jgi:hypothetical protein
MTGPAEPTRAEVEQEFPGWQVGRSTSLLWFAARRDGQGETVQGEDLMDLRDELRRAEAER